MSAAFARVALPLPVHTPYTYAVPDPLAGRLAVGARVLVPLRGRRLIGIVRGLDEATTVAAPKAILDAPDEPPVLAEPLLQLAEWMATYYGAPLGLAVRALLPADLWGSARGGQVDERVIALAETGLSLLEREARFRRKPRQRALYEALEAMGGSAQAAHLKERLGFDAALVRALVASGMAVVEHASRHRDPFAGLAASAPPEDFTADQRAALGQLEALGAGGTALLYGVTGSGKTLVYLEAIRRALARGEGAIVLVPEISLTPQTVSRLRGAFGDAVAVLHSGLSDGERADAWRALRRGDRRVAVGARSAIFAPIERLGIIAIDEEHEASYKNGEAPRYHARDVARVRARLEGARLILGSATPSLEALELVPAAAREIRLPQRIGDRPLPPVELVDLRTAPQVREASPVPWSEALDEALARTVARGEQAILLLNRRGFAAYVQCPACGDVPQCPSCSISLTVHRTPEAMRCHYCGHEERLSLACRACGTPGQVMRGVGTQQVEEVVAARLPSARLVRMDMDTTSTKWSHQRLLDRVDRHEVDVLIGTQMIAKGLDFPNVTLVGVVDADTGLHLPDFRAAERTFQLLAQVAGRAGRGPRGGTVLVQTRNPEHHALRHASRHDTDGFVAEERALRASPPYPPVTGLVNLLCSGEDEAEVSAAAARVADWCVRLVVERGVEMAVLGPAPAPLARIKGRWRWHVVLKGAPAVLGRVVRYASRRLDPGPEVKLVIDRDPVTLL